MSVIINVSTNGNSEYGTVSNVSKKAQEQSADKNRFFVGNNTSSDPVESKRKEALKKALKVVKDAWQNDRDIDENINHMKNHYEQMKQIMVDTKEHLDELSAGKDKLAKTYSVIEDSDEYRDLQLLEKRQNYNAKQGDKLTKEELERLKEIDAKPLTEYQKRSLEINSQMIEDRRIIEDAEIRIENDVANIQSIRVERLKSNPMVDAQKEAESIIESANKEIIGMLIDEAKESIEEKQEEITKKAEKAAEEKKEKEEHLEDMREMRKIKEAMIEGTKEAVEKAKAERDRNEGPDIETGDMLDLLKSNVYSEDIKQSLNEIKNSMKLVEADFKGVTVDTGV